MKKFIWVLNIFCFVLMATYAEAGQKKLDDVFGLDINKLTGAEVLKILKAKGIQYTPQSEIESKKPDADDPDVLVTPYYIGQFLDRSEILRTTYVFPPFGLEGNFIEIQIKGNYYTTLLDKLMKIYGPNANRNGEINQNYYWRNEDKTQYSFAEVFLSDRSEIPPPTGNRLSLMHPGQIEDVYYLYLRGFHTDCLPPRVRLTTRITRDSPFTVGDKLAELKAKCLDGKLVDGAGREIHFFVKCGPGMKIDWKRWKRIAEGWAKEIKELQKKYTVIEMECPYHPQ